MVCTAAWSAAASKGLGVQARQHVQMLSDRTSSGLDLLHAIQWTTAHTAGWRPGRIKLQARGQHIHHGHIAGKSRSVVAQGDVVGDDTSQRHRHTGNRLGDGHVRQSYLGQHQGATNRPLVNDNDKEQYENDSA